MPPPPFFIVAVNLYLIYVLFKKPRAKPRTMYYEEQNTKLVFELDGGPLTKDAFEETYKPKPKPMPVYSDNYIDKYLLKDSDIKEHIPKIEVVPDIVLNNVPEVVQDILQDIVLNNVPEVVPDIVIEAIPDIVQDTLQEAIPDIVQDTLQEVVPDIVQDTLQEVVPEVVPTIYAKYFTNFDRIAFSQTNIKNYTVVVHYENKTSSISNSDYVQVIPIYMNVVALMNPK